MYETDLDEMNSNKIISGLSSGMYMVHCTTLQGLHIYEKLIVIP